MKISLIGFMGSGKTTVGMLLSRKLKFDFVNLDDEIERITGMKIPEIFARHGEEYFRTVEKETFLKTVAKPGNTIISTGGGMPAFNDNITLIKRHTTSVYLMADFETVWNRIKNDSKRPLVKLGKKHLKKLFEKRKKFYEQADIKIDTEGKSPERITHEIINAIQCEQTKQYWQILQNHQAR
ncbi:shikimate kinase [Desulfurobacterium sp.]